MSKHGKVLVAMSGGVDSCITALLLHEQGYEVVGMTMKTWDYAFSGGTQKETGCCSLDSINDARAVAVKNGFPHYILDIRKDFEEYVVNNFIEEYLAGRTPNPCVLCNTHIKWEALLKRAHALGCESIATGHYARVRKENGRYVISNGIDEHKDQSYVLWGLSQKSLSSSIFPLGRYKKSEIKQMAVDYGFKELAEKSESYEICFVPDNDYRSFLKRRKKGLEQKVDGGTFVTTKGDIVGKHKGYPFYTIGQRKGLDVALGKPMYVTEIIPESNTVVIDAVDGLRKKEMYVHKINLIKYDKVRDGMNAITMVRYSDKGTLSKLFTEKKRIKVKFVSAVQGIAPGQSAVFYEKEDVIGGGIIYSGLNGE